MEEGNGNAEGALETTGRLRRVGGAGRVGERTRDAIVPLPQALRR